MSLKASSRLALVLVGWTWLLNDCGCDGHQELQRRMKHEVNWEYVG